jgi:hypothetical protein
MMNAYINAPYIEVHAASGWFVFVCTAFASEILQMLHIYTWQYVLTQNTHVVSRCTLNDSMYVYARFVPSCFLIFVCCLQFVQDSCTRTYEPIFGYIKVRTHFLYVYVRMYVCMHSYKTKDTKALSAIFGHSAVCIYIYIIYVCVYERIHGISLPWLLGLVYMSIYVCMFYVYIPQHFHIYIHI